MTAPARIAGVALVAVLALGGAGGYVLDAHRGAVHARAAAAPVATTTLAALKAAGPYLVFRDTARDGDYGKVAAVSAADPGGPRAVIGRTCDRVFARAGRVLCLATRAGILTSYTAQVYDGDLGTALQPLALTGIPSRARLSQDGTLAATTSFVSGDSYATTTFSTRTVISGLGSGTSMDLEDFSLIDGGHPIAPADRNLWGVSFARGDRMFYATAGYGGGTHLVRGDLVTRTLTTLQTDAECPSLSPDGTRLVYKQRGGLPPGRWRLVGEDLTTGTVTPLAESRSVDDQVEWLDATHVAYGLPRSGSDSVVSDVWSVPADGTGRPALLIPQAWSPSLVTDAR